MERANLDYNARKSAASRRSIPATGPQSRIFEENVPAQQAIEQALTAERELQLGRAIQILEDAWTALPDNAQIAKHLARLSLRINEIRAFVNWCHEALRIDPRDPEPHVMLAEHLAAQSRWAEARAEAEAALNLSIPVPALLERARRLAAGPPKKLRWGVLGAAKIALTKVIPAMLRGTLTSVVALASREESRAWEAAARLGIDKAYNSYEALLADPDIDAIYNPLPNHLHVPWTEKAARAGKHVLCEKPIALKAAEARTLIPVRDQTGVLIAEAFMVRTHPQWIRTRELVAQGEIGTLRTVLGAFSYFNRDAANIRNVESYGGGALMDIGCYPVHLSRWLFGAEPKQCVALMERDPDFGTDRLTSALMHFPDGHAVFHCSTQQVPYQRMQILGTEGRIEVEIPFNAPPDHPARILIDRGGALDGSGIRIEEFPVCDQYTLQGDAFARAVRGDLPVPVSLEDSVANMQAIESLFRSVSWGRWESPGDVPCETCP